ncbi:MAG: ComF family protein [Candidatus Aegiribacteria sp.]|nr:ComF family protein [Candidatus Aegiribacteria sp.]
MAISSISKNILSLFLRKVCPACGSRLDGSQLLCPWCELRLDRCSEIHWSSTGSSFSNPSDHLETGVAGVPVYSAVMYAGVPGEIVVRLKFNGEKHLAKAAAGMIMQYSIRLPDPGDILVPVPAGRKRKRERGYNQAALITAKLASMSGCRSLDILKKDDGPSQVGLSPSQRRQNVAGIFQMKGRCRVPDGVDIWLVDDVATTCSTIDSAAGVLLDSGALRVTGLTLAYRKRTADSIVQR